ncbi:hypothetical protein [uncultured Flavobacterium sp.]|uniref:hypothetical protein n=1 Tax=uncultured Flavobacterium sp. TaxID=165435 RepID=UPI0030EBFBE1|tara:strand:+ start:19227 stop:20273 length:1047 start_codon:yes stop_codon:yes gene_type:complete
MIYLYTAPTNEFDHSKGYINPLLDFLAVESRTVTPIYELKNDMPDADFAVLPLAIEYFKSAKQKEYLDSFISEAVQNGKPILLFSTGDFGTTRRNSLIYTLRLSGFDSQMDSRTEMMPPFFLDPLLFLNKEFKIVSKTEQPKIGFVGHANGEVVKLIKEFILFLKGNGLRLIGKDNTDYQKFYPSSYYRNVYLKSIQKNKGIVTDFIFRKKYRAGVVTEADRHRTSKAFYKNIFENQYVFCLRGTGNFSVRFYETLALGRIPVLINTDCRLPFKSKINWTRHCLIIQEGEEHTIAEKIIEFHNSLTNVQFEEMQRGNRELWENHFTKEKYFVEYAKVVQEQIVNSRND